MKILYGVQGTGNGHLTRARAMAEVFSRRDIDVDFIFTGRAAEDYFAMECFGEPRYFKGLTFHSVNGVVDYPRTLLRNSYAQFFSDLYHLDVSAYDLIVTDFEPLTAWAGRCKGKTVISLGHQPAFDHDVPKANEDLCGALVLRFFAPGDLRIGMHWGKFDAPILPPLVDQVHVSVALKAPVNPQKVLVYLPFEPLETVRKVLLEIPDYEFYCYSPEAAFEDDRHVHLRPPALAAFREDLQTCTAVIANAGFELASECLALGKRLLVKPQGKQTEQASNAMALQELGYARVFSRIESGAIRCWLESSSRPPRLAYPDVAAALVDWIEKGAWDGPALDTLSEQLWAEVQVDKCHGRKAVSRPLQSIQPTQARDCRRNLFASDHV